jgi:hypothetical protein
VITSVYSYSFWWSVHLPSFVCCLKHRELRIHFHFTACTHISISLPLLSCLHLSTYIHHLSHHTILQNIRVGHGYQSFLRSLLVGLPGGIWEELIHGTPITKEPGLYRNSFIKTPSFFKTCFHRTITGSMRGDYDRTTIQDTTTTMFKSFIKTTSYRY